MVKLSPAYHLLRARSTSQCSGKKEKERRIKVVFLPKAWCDKNIKKSWDSEDWCNHFLNPATTRSTGNRGGCRGLPLLPMQHPEIAHISALTSSKTSLENAK